MAIDADFANINVVKSWNRIRWPHNGPAYGGERRVPRRVEGRLVEKVNLLVDRALGGNSIQGVISLVDAVQDS